MTATLPSVAVVTTQPQLAPRPAPSAPTILLFERVSKWYGPVIGVNEVTLELRAGITGLVGSNGAGKSTLMRLATGQSLPHSGTVSILGHDAGSSAARLLVGYSPEVDAFYEEMSGEKFVLTMARLIGFTAVDARRRTSEVLELVGMTGRSDRKIRGYSKGMRQRIKVAQALLADPPLLILDEPLSGIDPVGRQEFIQLFLALAAQGKCLLISSHELDELEKLTDHVAIMARGRIAAIGSIAELRARIEDRPLAIRIDVGHADGNSRHRDLAGSLMHLAEVERVDVQATDDPLVGRLVVNTRKPREFFRRFSQLVAEEWYEIRHLETLDQNTAAVVNYLLGGA